MTNKLHMQEEIGFIGRISYKKIDLITGDVLSEGEGKNLVVDVGRYAVADSMTGGTPFVFTQIKAGTGTHVFVESDTDLTTPVSTSPSITISSVNDVMTITTLLTFDGIYQIEELGLYSAAGAFALTNAISETVSATQGLGLTWVSTITS